MTEPRTTKETRAAIERTLAWIERRKDQKHNYIPISDSMAEHLIAGARNLLADLDDREERNKELGKRIYDKNNELDAKDREIKGLNATITRLTAENERLKGVATSYSALIMARDNERERLTAERDEAIARINTNIDQMRYLSAEREKGLARIADLEARLAEEKERCAKVADSYADENIRMASDTIICDPCLHGGDFSDEAVQKSENLQMSGAIHSAMYHAATNIAAAIRSLPAQKGE